MFVCHIQFIIGLLHVHYCFGWMWPTKQSIVDSAVLTWIALFPPSGMYPCYPLVSASCLSARNQSVRLCKWTARPSVSRVPCGVNRKQTFLAFLPHDTDPQSGTRTSTTGSLCLSTSLTLSFFLSCDTNSKTNINIHREIFKCTCMPLHCCECNQVEKIIGYRSYKVCSTLIDTHSVCSLV